MSRDYIYRACVRRRAFSQDRERLSSIIQFLVEDCTAETYLVELLTTRGKKLTARKES